MRQRVKNFEEFKAIANEVHNSTYDYSESEYVDSKTKIKIGCPIHGFFFQRPNNHLSGQGCPECGKIKNNKENERRRTQSKETFKERANLIHNGKYNYDSFVYVNTHTKGDILCPIHGVFQQSPHHHLNGSGCPKCGYDIVSSKLSGNTTSFIEKATRIHHGKYDYSKVNYVNNRTKVCIICPKHGEFWQGPGDHLEQKGCFKCNSSKLEAEIRDFLINESIPFIEQYNSDWLGEQTLDFYIPQYKVGVECQGIQHFKPLEFFKGLDGFQSTVKRDKAKLEKCKANNVKLLYYSNLGITYPYQVYEDKEKLLEEIKKCEL